MQLIQCDIFIIGAGVVGLAAGAIMAAKGYDVIIAEREKHVGSMTSSRNSEVIHSGIYYETGSLKAQLCLRGKKLLYNYLTQRSIPHSECGKIIFSNNLDSEQVLNKLYENAIKRQIRVKYCNKQKLYELNRIVNVKAAIEVPETGIFDSHSFLHCLVSDIGNNGGLVALNTSVKGFTENNKKMQIICEQNQEKFIVESKFVLNTSGSAALKFLKNHFPEKYRLYENFYVKGNYFAYKRQFNIKELLYPIPSELGLGVHLTRDLAGNIRFGPDVQLVSNSSNLSQQISDAAFYERIVKNFPLVKRSDIRFSYAGIRPKVKYDGKVYNDFIFCSDYGGKLISTLGIESPGLTSSLAIGEYMLCMIDR